MTTINEERAGFEDYCREIGYTLKVGDSGRYLGGYGAELWAGFKAGAAWQRAQGAVPEWWKLVPVEPTHGMRKRAQGYLAAEGVIVSDWLINTAYRELLAAAPAHPAERQALDKELRQLQAERDKAVRELRALLASVEGGE